MVHHVPVLAGESKKYLVTNVSGSYFDGTLGFGGHSFEFLKQLDPSAILVATDRDINAFNYCKNKFKDDPRVKLYHTNYSNIDIISKIENLKGYTGIFLDLGVSSYQYDNTDAGFTYRHDAELDLRMNKSEGVPAWKIVNEKSIDELKTIFQKFGEERRAGYIAKKIFEVRKRNLIRKTNQLKEIIESITPFKYRMNTVSRIFQSLRIYVNNELEELESFLNKSMDLLLSGGRIGVISYHSLEDRIVKNKFKYESLSCVCPPELPVCKCNKTATLNIITKKPLIPHEEEIAVNKRARSAKLRVAEKI